MYHGGREGWLTGLVMLVPTFWYPSLEKIDLRQYNSQNYVQLSDNIFPLMFHSISICARASVWYAKIARVTQSPQAKHHVTLGLDSVLPAIIRFFTRNEGQWQALAWSESCITISFWFFIGIIKCQITKCQQKNLNKND